MGTQVPAGAGFSVLTPRASRNSSAVINAKLNKKILAVWKKHFGNDKEVYAPIFFDDFEHGGLLFIGINPSLNPKGQKKVREGTEFEHLDPEFYRWNNIASNPDYVDTCIKSGRHTRAKYRYFARMHEMTKQCKTHFQHIDLFVYRQTKQKEFLPLIREDRKGNLNEFGRDQIAIFLEALKEIRPAVIVVSNAVASKIIKEQLKDDLSFDDERGFHWLALDGVRVPIFFSSMLSGGGALDTGSYERLRWHVGKAFDYKQQSPRLSVTVGIE
jgi:hypothetical protein